MGNQVKLLILILLFPLFGCVEVSNADKLRIDEIAENTEINQVGKSKLYVFVGEKIEVVSFEPEIEKGEVLMDFSFKAKYRVIQNVYGKYDKDIIEFEVYDHYGIPPFSKYKNVLLFVSEYEGKLYHEKYQYFDVYQTKNGKWASCGDPYRKDDYHRKNFQAVNLEFNEPLIFDLNDYKKDYRPEYVKEFFKSPYFKIADNKAQCLMGAFVEDLFKIKKEGVLKARGLF
jgi:hypothetical protein